MKKEKKEADRTFEERFVGELDRFLVSPHGERRVSRLAFRPSSYYKCIRQTYYFLKGIPSKRNEVARSMRILEVGTALHEWIQRSILMEMDKEDKPTVTIVPVEEIPSFGEEGIEFFKHPQNRAIIKVDDEGNVDIIETYSEIPATEVKFVDTRWTEHFPISAMVDGYLQFVGKEFLFEFKTINPKDFELLFEPLTDHIKQGAIYALSTGVRSVMFLYLCKGTQALKPYLVTYTDKQLEWVVNRMKVTEEFVVKDELPPKEVTKNCTWCGYKKLCDKELKMPEEKA